MASDEPPKLSREEIAKRAARLLDRAPVLDPLPADALSERAFIDEVEQLIREDVDDVQEAIEELEGRLKKKGSDSGGNRAIRLMSKAIKIFGEADTQRVIGSVDPVTAVISSVPSNLSVRYYRKLRPNQKLDTTTDKVNLNLDPPAIWVFECTHNGVVRTQVISCTSNCSVHFVF